MIWSPSFILPYSFSIQGKTKGYSHRTSKLNPYPCKASLVSSDVQTFISLVQDTQQRLCKELEYIDGKSKFCSDPWTSERGSGLTRVLQDGAIFEKAGVNISIVEGVLSEARAKALRRRGKEIQTGEKYRAAALSFVLHAQSPHVPTLRGDVRIFASEGGISVGGGVDLTIFYVCPEQISAFHRHWKRVCDAYDVDVYAQLKKQCDEYFYIPSRGEHRGVGGLFYDDLPLSPALGIPFSSDMLDNFLPSYLPILRNNSTLPYTAQEKRWQRIRRGRYLEFNLLNDRGVRFGLAGAHYSRTDAIMISAPPSVEWPYGYEVEVDSPEMRTIHLLRGTPIDWAHFDHTAGS